MDRVRAWLSGLPTEGRVVAFTHAGVVREALWSLMPGAPRVQVLGHAAITRVHIAPGEQQIVVLDDHRHLSAVP